MRIFHIALESDWRTAQRTGEYTTSTLGRTLAEEGFIHASREDQVKGVHDAFYSEVRKPLVRLDIDTDRLRSEWREDPVGDDAYPHIYGPLNVDAVVAANPWHRSGREKAFLEIFLTRRCSGSAWRSWRCSWHCSARPSDVRSTPSGGPSSARCSALGLGSLSTSSASRRR